MRQALIHRDVEGVTSGEYWVGCWGIQTRESADRYEKRTGTLWSLVKDLQHAAETDRPVIVATENGVWIMPFSFDASEKAAVGEGTRELSRVLFLESDDHLTVLFSLAEPVEIGPKADFVWKHLLNELQEKGLQPKETEPDFVRPMVPKTAFGKLQLWAPPNYGHDPSRRYIPVRAILEGHRPPAAAVVIRPEKRRPAVEVKPIVKQKGSKIAWQGEWVFRCSKGLENTRVGHVTDLCGDLGKAGEDQGGVVPLLPSGTAWMIPFQVTHLEEVDRIVDWSDVYAKIVFTFEKGFVLIFLADRAAVGMLGDLRREIRRNVEMSGCKAFPLPFENPLKPARNAKKKEVWIQGYEGAGPINPRLALDNCNSDTPLWRGWDR